MAEALELIYESLTEEDKQEVFDFINFLAAKRQKERQKNKNHFSKFLGTISSEDAKIMQDATIECRRIEPNEW